MKCIKLALLAAVMALAVCAFGAGTASATVFCKSPISPCPSKYPKGTKLHLILQSGSLLVKKSDDRTTTIDDCQISTLEMTTTNEGSAVESVGATLNVLTLGNCHWPNAVEVLGSLEFHYDGKTGTTVVTGKNTLITERVNFLTHCYYGFGSGTTLGTLTQPASSTSDTLFHLNATLNRIKGEGVCPASTVWEATYTVTSPVPLYVTSS